MFKQDITRSIGKILKNNQYKMIPLDSRCIYFAKRYSDKLAFYVRCVDNQCVNQTINIKFFFAPIRTPDDCIISMDMGIHINVLKVKEDEYTDEIMEVAGKKIISLEKRMGGLQNIINKEIEAPYFPSELTKAYSNELLIYDTIMNDENLKENIIVLKSRACENIKKKKRNATHDLCSEIIEKLPPNYFVNAGIDATTDEIIDIVSELLWAQCVLDV